MNLRIVKEEHHHEDHHCSDEENPDDTLTTEQHPISIFDAETLVENVPDGFDAVRVPIDGTLKSDLDWSTPAAAAGEYIAAGKKIFWELDLGLFDRLGHPLDHQGQFQSLLLSLEHFRDTLWEQFRDDTVGLCMYRGKADFTGDVSPEAAAEYLGMLAQRLPDTIPRYVLLDATHVGDPLRRAQLLSKERYFHFLVGVMGARGCGGDLGWSQEPLAMGYLGRTLRTESYEAPSCAICLPSHEAMEAVDVAGMRRLFEVVEKQGIPFRVIPESYLTVSWDGLDVIYVAEEYLTPQGKRMLNGFRAAGGTIR